MADTDTIAKQFVKDKDIFADAFNFYLYGGKEVLKPEQLHVADTTEVVVPYGEDDTGIRIQPVQKIRDAFYSVMETDRKVYMLCGIENQKSPHNAMPVRNALYDFMEYAAQIQEAAKAHKDAKNRGQGNDFLSGFHTSDKLIPVYTLVIFWGPGEWNAPKSLFEMYDIENEEDYNGLNDWKINLITPNEMSEEDVMKFHSDLGKALYYVKNMGDPEMIKKISSDERYRRLRTNTVLLLNEVMNTNFPISEKEDLIDMSYAVEKIKEEASVSAVINALRKLKISDNEILCSIMEQFSLTEKDAKNYMLKESA